MSLVSAAPLFTARNSRSASYQIEQSLRFNNSGTYLHRTPSSAGNRQTWTYSVWIKRCLNGTWPHYHGIFSANNYIGNDWDLHGIEFSGTNFNINSRAVISQNNQYSANTENKFRDPSAWMHIVAAFNTTSATSSERLKIWVNGVLVTFTGSLPAQNFSGRINTTSQHRIGSSVTTGEQHCYMAEAHFVDGTALDHEDFGEFDANGVWRPIEVSGLTYGTNGFYLKFDPTATNGIGHDHSGNGNNWTPVAFTTSGTGTDVMSDTPTTNWATLNPLETFNGRFSNAPTNGNLEISIPSDGTLKRNYAGMHASIVVPTTGKYYFEFEASQQYTRFVAVDVEYSYSVSTGDDYALTNKKSVIFDVFDGNYYYDGANNSTASGHGANSAPSGDIYGVAIDLGNGTLRVDLNGTAGTELDISDWAGGSARVAAFVAASTSSGTIKYNFGAQGFAHTPPTGFKALNTSNLSAPPIKDGSDYFNTVLWTGTSAENPISTVGFQPDFTWIKGRDNSTGHILVDAVRGATKVLESDSDAVEYTNAQSVKSFDTNGFTLGTENDVNNSTAGYNQYVGWSWLAGGSGSSNTAGSLSNTVTVSANPSAGFSIVKYTGDGVSNATVGHGLGVVPSLVISKVLSGSTGPWYVKHKDLSSGYNIYLNWTDAQTALTSGGGIGDLNSSTTFTCANGSSNNGNVNASGRGYITYCFAEVEGYSKFGSYTGNGSSDGPFVHLGFKPSFLVIKRSDSTESWLMFDSTRETYNPTDDVLWANLANTESSNYTPQDFLSNGLKIRTSSTSTNASGGTYIFMAFAENPFGGSNVSPATAR